MKTNFARLSAAVALGLSLMGASLAADAASAAPTAKTHQIKSASVSGGQGKVIHLGTITVTRADMDGPHKSKGRAPYGSTAYLGKVNVTAQDTLEAHAAAASAKKQGALFLGTVMVTQEDSLDARYAASLANTPGTLYLGTVRVTARDAKAPVIGGVMAATHYLGPKAVLSMISALVFERAGG
jgi:hypothetical protein